MKKMMKKVLSYILQFSVLLPAMIGMVRLSNYFLELDSYKAQCKNKDSTEITCNGLCKLSEQISLESKDYDPQMPIIPTVENILPLFILEQREDIIKHISWKLINSSNTFHYRNLTSQKAEQELLKPPTVG